MSAIKRSASGTWSGDLRTGNGRIGSTSGVLENTPFTFATRFENAKGTNPEELIAAAHAACYSMALSNMLSQKGHVPDEVATTATVTLEGGKISEVHLHTRGRVPGLEREAFLEVADEASKACPVSKSYRDCIAISLDADLV